MATRYAVRIMIDLAQHEKASVRCIAKRQRVGRKYAEAILATLRREGLVRSIRGTHGGYVLARPAKEITLGEIVRCTDKQHRPSDDPRDRATEEAFSRVQDAVWEVLDGMTLADAMK